MYFKFVDVLEVLKRKFCCVFLLPKIAANAAAFTPCDHPVSRCWTHPEGSSWFFECSFRPVQLGYLEGARFMDWWTARSLSLFDSLLGYRYTIYDYISYHEISLGVLKSWDSSDILPFPMHRFSPFFLPHCFTAGNGPQGCTMRRRRGRYLSVLEDWERDCWWLRAPRVKIEDSCIEPSICGTC